MSKKGLTAKQVEHMPAQSARQEVAAGPPSGLYLVIQPTGGKSWAFRYRFNGRTRKLTFKPYPEMGLAAARAEAEAAIEDLEKNINPAATIADEKATDERQEQTEMLQRESVGEAAEEFIKRGLRQKEKERGETERIIRKEILSKWKLRTASEIQKRDALDLLHAIHDRGAPVMAVRTRGVMIRFFEWCIDNDRGMEESPMSGIKKKRFQDHKPRKRFLAPEELAEVWNAAGEFGYPGGDFVRFLILTAQRRGEVATMKWKHIDLREALWTIPAELTKNGREHQVPLSTAALKILKKLPTFAKGSFVWTNTSGEKPINGFSNLKEAIDRRTLKDRNANGIEKNIPNWTMHDLRRTGVTLMAKHCGVAEHVLTRIINHTTPAAQVSEALRFYNQHPYMPERREALEAWGNFILRLKKQKSATPVSQRNVRTG